MKGLAVFIVVVFACVYSLSAQSCNNPLFSHCRDAPACQIHYLSTPQPKPASVGICGDIPAGGSSCCDATIYNTISNAWNNAHRDIQTSVNSYQNELLTLRFYGAFAASFADQVDSNPTLTPAQKTAIKNAYYGIQTAVNNFANQGTAPVAKCFSSILNYYAGVVCFACSPNWSNYVYLNATTGRYTFLVDSNTCTQLGSSCGAFFDSLKTFLQTITNLQTQLDAVLNTTRNDVDNDTDTDPICGPTGDCQAYVCKNLISGLSFNNPLKNGSLGGDDSGFSSTSNNKRWVATAKKVHSNIISQLNKVNSARSQLGLMVEENRVAVRDTGSSSSAADNIDVVVKAGGYPAYSNGQQSKLDSSVQSGSATSLKSWVSFLLF